MNCGKCDEEMADGKVEVHGTIGGFLLFGWSLQHLYWYASDRVGRKATMVVGSGRARDAWACRECGLITINAGGEASKGTRGSF